MVRLRIVWLCQNKRSHRNHYTDHEAGASLAHVSYLLLKQSISRHFCLCLAGQESPSFSCGLGDTCQCPEWGDSLERLELNTVLSL